MNHFIIATHSILAEGFLKAIEFFLPDSENIEFINAYVDSQDFESELRIKIEQNDNKNLIICTDMKGGSVNQIACRLLDEYDNSYKIVSGINLSLLLQLVLAPNELTETDLKEAITLAKEEIVFMNELLNEMREKDD